MKTFFTLFLILFAHFTFSQTFQGCNNAETISGQTAHNLKSILDAPHKAVRLEIDVSELKHLEKLEKIDVSKFTRLQLIEVKITEDPQASDETKKSIIKKLEKEVELLNKFGKAPSLKWIRFAIGERLYINSDETVSGEKVTEINLQRAYNSIGMKTEKLLPNISVCVYDWGW
jgi:hypothetical protein